MEIILLLIYSFFVWLIFFKFKWLPWNIVSQVIVLTLPIIGLTVLILCLNVYAPSSHDVRALNYVVQVVPRVTGRVIEVPVEPNRPIKKGDVLFRIDPVPFQLAVEAAQANISQLKAKLITAQSNQTALDEQLNAATSKKASLTAKIDLVRKRLDQFRQLAESGAGNRFDYEQAESDLASLNNELASLAANEAEVRIKIAAKTPEGEQDEVAQVKAQLAQAQAQLADAEWSLKETVVYAPANGTIVNLQLRVGSTASQFAGLPVMTFVEDEQWIMMLFKQNEVREVEPDNDAEIAMRMYPGRIIKCKVDSVVWATAQGQLPLSGAVPDVR